MTWLDVLDDAIKIGLGAAIGGMGAIYNFRHARYMEYSRRRRDLIEKACIDVQAFCDDIKRSLTALLAAKRSSIRKEEFEKLVIDFQTSPELKSKYMSLEARLNLASASSAFSQLHQLGFELFQRKFVFESSLEGELEQLIKTVENAGGGMIARLAGDYREG